MKKKILAVMLAVACAIGAVPAATAAKQPVTAEAAAKKPSINQVYSAVKGAYGDDYLPSVRLKKDEINSLTKILFNMQLGNRREHSRTEEGHW